ncbi:hypothetical protein LCGC14_1969520 [marine sediment metagenome]|uniref:Uncharacterized protein n=1 Tax=marine sediment metagenome TaxID=412755 RepID=A0A0F9FCL2_9ZZZZ
MDNEGWIGVDLDGTLAYYDEWRGEDHIGKPIPKMLARVKLWIKEGRTVKIFTARASDNNNQGIVVPAIEQWLKDNGLPELEVTDKKDYFMTELWDDRCVQVIPNTGERVDVIEYKRGCTNGWDSCKEWLKGFSGHSNDVRIVPRSSGK